MKVRLIAKTWPELFHGSISTPEHLMAYCARVSSSNQDNPDTNKLLSYMIRNQHWSPFEMANVVMEIETTRDIARQILRHRSFSFQEFSQRYAKVQEYATREPRYQDAKNRQSSIDFVIGDEADEALRNKWFEYQRKVRDLSAEAYNWALDNDIAKEQARVFLPEGLTSSRMYMNGTIRSWIHYIDLRTGNGTQKEHREVAEECKKILMQEFPFLHSYWGTDLA